MADRVIEKHYETRPEESSSMGVGAVLGIISLVLLVIVLLFGFGVFGNRGFFNTGAPVAPQQPQMEQQGGEGGTGGGVDVDVPEQVDVNLDQEEAGAQEQSSE